MTQLTTTSSSSSSSSSSPLVAVRRLAAWMAAIAVAIAVTLAWGSSTPANAAPSRSVRAGEATRPTVASAATTPAPDGARPARRSSAKAELSGKLNLNAASAEQLMMLPGVGPAKAERVVAWRAKYGTFKRVADLRKVKGFGYKSLKKLEPYLDIKGETTLASK